MIVEVVKPRRPGLPPSVGGTAVSAPTSLRDEGLSRALRQINLDLLPILHELLKTRNVSRTARHFGMAQPSVSKALGELRRLFDDDLLVFLGRDVRLTAKAQALAAPVAQILSEIGHLLRPDEAFAPASEALRVVIGAPDYASALLAPALMKICGEEAPAVTIEFTEASIRTLEELAGVDILVAPRGHSVALGKRAGSMPLWRDDTVCIAAAGRTDLPASITPEAFGAARHVGYQMRPGPLTRDVAAMLPPTTLEIARVCTVPDFLVLGAIVEKSDCLALVPRLLARDFARQRSIQLIELEFADRYVDVDAFWSHAVARRRGHDWLRGLLTRAAAALT